MASAHHYLNETQVVWQQFISSKTEDLAIAEVWRSTEGRPHATISIHRKVSKPELQGWLQQTNGARSWIDTIVKRSCVLRIVWILLDTKRRIVDVDAVLFEEICTAFRHQLAQTYCTTQYAGVGYTIDHETGKNVYFLCNHPKLAVTWSHDIEVGVTSMICVADRSKLNILQNMMDSKFIQNLAHHEMTPALMSALMSSKEIDTEVSEVKKLVREVEVRTGYHEWTGRAEDSARGDLVGLSARMSGCGTRIGSNTRKLGVIAEFGHFIRNHLEAGMDVGSKEELLELNHIIERRTAMQALDLKYTLSRIRTQKEALFNLISANDSASVQHIAEESRQIAWATRSDAHSMKLLALMTTIFLPGTFVSGLFSTPMFSRESKDTVDDTIVKVWKPGLVLYFAVSLPLLVMTLLIWGLWTFGHKLKNERYVRTTRKRLSHNVGYTEKENLIMRQAAISQELL